jgi:hypothetical protein
MTNSVKSGKSGWRWAFLISAIGMVILLIWLIKSAPKYPVAALRVVDAAGKPVAGAVILAEGLRTKPGPYAGGWYGWSTEKSGVPKNPVITDKNGYAQVPYPKYVFERIETGKLCLSVEHPDYVSDRPERVVTTALPAGAPWKIQVEDVWNRIRHNALVAKVDPVVLKKGMILKLMARSGMAEEMPLFAQVSRESGRDTNFWMRPEQGVLLTHRLEEGTQAVRVVQFDARNAAWFSEVTNIVIAAGVTNEATMELKRGVTVRGQLGALVPRPVVNGRVIAHVWPIGYKAEDSPPQWHAWTEVRGDGSFEIGSLPPGDLEVVALCNGFVSTNGPGKFQMRYPQKHVLGTNDLTITIGMEPTVQLEVLVTDDQGKPLKDAQVSAWPNVRYGEWAAVVLATDCYNSAEWFSLKPTKKSENWFKTPADFTGVSDSAGMAVLPNLPVTVKEITADHPQFAAPVIVSPWGDKSRIVTVTLVAGQTNHAAIGMEPKERAPIGHY